MTIEQREILCPRTFKVPLEKWHPVNTGDVLYEASEDKLRLTREEALISRVEVDEDDSLKVTLYIVDIPYDIAEHQRSNIGHKETLRYDKEKLKTLIPKRWFRNDKFLRGFQLRVR